MVAHLDCRESRHISHGIKASFWRGGTSNGVLFNEEEFPHEVRQAWRHRFTSVELRRKVLDPFFAAIMGSPDPYGRQLNGMGGGTSSLSKAVVVERARCREGDLDYTYIQIGIKDGTLDFSGNCGNMTAAVVPFAINEGLVELEDDMVGPDGSVSVRTFNYNTNKVIQITTAVSKVRGRWMFNPLGDCSIDGTPGLASTILLSFLDPAGSRTGTGFPTENLIDEIDIGCMKVQASCVDVCNPGIFIRGEDVGWNSWSTPDELNANAVLVEKLEKIRRKGAVMMGLDPIVVGVPQVVMVFGARDEHEDFCCQVVSAGQAHQAIPVTFACNAGVSSKIAGTIPNQLSRNTNPTTTAVGHPSGKIEVGAIFEDQHIDQVFVVRTARCHMDGIVNYEENLRATHTARESRHKSSSRDRDDDLEGFAKL